MININHIIPNFLSYIIFLTIHFSSYSKFQIYLPPLHFLFNLYFTFVARLCAVPSCELWHISCVSQIERDREREFLVKKLLQLLLLSSVWDWERRGLGRERQKWRKLWQKLGAFGFPRKPRQRSPTSLKTSLYVSPEFSTFSLALSFNSSLYSVSLITHLHFSQYFSFLGWFF